MTVGQGVAVLAAVVVLTALAAGFILYAFHTHELQQEQQEQLRCSLQGALACRSLTP